MPDLVPLDSLVNNANIKRVEISSSYLYSQMSISIRAGNTKTYQELAKIVNDESYLVTAAGGGSFNVVKPYVTIEKTMAIRLFSPSTVYVRAAI